MTKTLEERAIYWNYTLRNPDSDIYEKGFSAADGEFLARLSDDQQARIRELETEPTEEEVEAAAIGLYAVLPDFDDAGRRIAWLNLKEDFAKRSYRRCAKAALEAARKVRITKK